MIKSVSTSQTLKTTYHTINQDHSIRLDNLCNDLNTSDTYILFVCLTNSMGDGPLSFAKYFHIQSSPPINLSINSLDVNVISSREISVQWSVNEISPFVNYRIQWMAANEKNREKSFIASHNDSSVILDNLSPFTAYKILMNAFYIHGNGLTQETDVIQTIEDGILQKI